MIISPKHKFVFVHIPKCAGTSVRTQVIKCDEGHISLGRVGEHPVLGKIDYGHVPLHQLRTHFPKYYGYLENFTTYAVVRDPLERFGSALRQVLWQYEKRPMTLIPSDELRKKTLGMLETIAQEIDAPSYQFIFFARQESFIFDENRRMVDHLIPVDLVADFIGYLSRKTGVAMETGMRSNQNVELRFKSFGGLAYRINGFLRDRLPMGAHTRIKEATLRVLSSKENAASASGILDMPEVRAFVTEHYARDFEIYRSIIEQQGKVAMGLANGQLSSSFLPPIKQR